MHAFADGQLSPERRSDVEAFLRVSPEAAKQVDDFRRLNAALCAAFKPAPVARRFPRGLAAALAGLIIGGATGWIGRGMTPAEPTGLHELAQRAVAAYAVYAPDRVHPVDMAGDQKDRLAAWLSNRMNMTVVLPRLDAAGFALLGGRLMVGEKAPAALLMYENGQGRRLILYVRNDLPKDPPSKMQYRQTDAGGIVYWRDAAAGFGLAGGFSEQELRPVADLIRADYRT
ncbi:MAG: hypothetical protein ABSA13_11605 [Beijerinckiaceae bacterium]